MQKDTWSVGFACALGAFIGALTSLEIASYFKYGSSFWILGMFVGGAVAYVAIDFRHFCAGVVDAYRTVINWRPHWLYWKAVIVFGTGLSVAILTVLSLMETLSGLTGPKHSQDFYALVVINIALICLAITCVLSKLDDDDAENLQSNIKLGWWLILNMNPIGMVWHACRGVCWAAVRLLPLTIRIVVEASETVPVLATMVKSFVAQVFIRVHSERRMICFVDASIGAAAGFFLGSAVLGALIGAVLGMVNYEIVSVRWLKLIPAKAKK